MKRALCGLALAFAISAFSQQQSPTNPTPDTTPPTFPDDQASRQEMPPDTKAPPPQGLSTAQVEQQIQEQIYMQKLQPALRAYLTKLREQAYIDIKPGFADTGASPNQTKPIITMGSTSDLSTASTKKPAKKKKKLGVL